ncbi:MAG: hypothetical protein NDJ89_02075 [Oligoflexia bacterium]|nr:hypothetical protein [Oligoflexia bacterium]
MASQTAQVFRGLSEKPVNSIQRAEFISEVIFAMTLIPGILLIPFLPDLALAPIALIGWLAASISLTYIIRVSFLPRPVLLQICDGKFLLKGSGLPSVIPFSRIDRIQLEECVMPYPPSDPWSGKPVSEIALSQALPVGQISS